MDTIIIEPKVKARAVIIWMHGLGASADDMASLAAQMPGDLPVKHVSLNAPIRPVTINQSMPMPAWYDIVGTTLTDREDEAGILDSSAQILTAVNAERAHGFEDHEIFLAGFSQGGAMALFTALHSLPKLGGVIALSAYLPLHDVCKMTKLERITPMFIAHGSLDPVVLPSWTVQTVAWLRSHGFETLTVRDYPMAHQVCIEEVKDLLTWLETKVKSQVSPN